MNLAQAEDTAPAIPGQPPEGEQQQPKEPDGYTGRHRAPSRHRRLLTVLAFSAVLASSLAIADASPAQAATPECTKTASFANGQATVFTPASSSDSWRCTMRRGTGWWSNDTRWHWGVFQLQEDLNRCYSNITGVILSTDGDFGGRTEAALIKVQRHLRSTVDASLAADGSYGPHTAKTMAHSAFAQTPYGTHYFCTRLP